MDTLTTRLRELSAATPWLVVFDADQSAVQVARTMLEAGAEEVLAVGVSTGTGELDDGIPLISLGLNVDGSMMDGVRAAERAVGELPRRVLAQIDLWDPHRRAQVLMSMTMRAEHVAGRPTFGSRPQAWEALEDKLVADSIWDAAGIDRVDSAVVELDDQDGLRRAHARLATEHGTVVAGDAAPGWHGGATSVRWVPDHGSLASVADDLRRQGHASGRMTPFLEGVPCSIHGMVIGDQLAVFRPCELLVLRDRTNQRFRYCGAATFWDPPAGDRAAMRAAATRVGEMLRDQHGYRGTYTIDGVLTATGFRPTELNSRFGVALALVGRGRPGANIYLTHCAALEGELDDLDAAALETWIVDGADDNRHGHVILGTDAAPRKPHRVMLAVDGAPDPVAATWGPAASGGLVVVELPPTVPVGPSLAPLVADVSSSLGELWDLGISALEPPSPAR